VSLAVDLDGQARRRTEEIEDVRPNRMLPAELGFAGFATAKALPEIDLGLRHLFAQGSSARDDR